MKKKYLYICIGVFAIIFLFGNYLGYKIYMAKYYSLTNMSSYESYSDGLVIKDTLNVKSTKLKDSEYLEFNDVKIRNDFKKFKKLDEPQSTDEYIKYVLYDENKKTKASLWISSSDTNMNLYKSEILVFNTDIAGYEEVNIQKYLEKKNIKTDIDLIKYLADTANKKNNVFTSVNDMKSNYAIHFLSNIIYTNVDGISLIDGDLEGYILQYNLNSELVKEINIIKNNKRYVLTLINLDYFTEEYIKDLLNTIVIK